MFSKQLLEQQAGAEATGKWPKEIVILYLQGRRQREMKCSTEAQGPWTRFVTGRGELTPQGLRSRCCSPTHSPLREAWEEGPGVLRNSKPTTTRLRALKSQV